MYVVGHQRVGVQRNLLAQQCFTEPVQVALVVLFAEEACFAVMTPLHDMQRQAIEVDAWATGHAGKSSAN